MMYTIEINSIHQDKDIVNPLLTADSKIVEVFSSAVNGKDMENLEKKIGKKTVKTCNEHIKELASRAINGDYSAKAELNTIRKYTIQPELMKEIQLLSFFGSYENVDYGESVEREVLFTEGELSRNQANNGDVTFGFIAGKTYPVKFTTISSGYQIDYRKLQRGDLSAENILKENIKRDIRNRASKYAINTLYNSIKNSINVKNFSESAGITKTALDKTVNFARKFGTPSIFGDYVVVSQINDFSNYTTSANANYMNISQDAMNEIRKTGLVSWYNGSVVYAVQNAFDTTKFTSDNTSFETILPEGLLFVVPNGIESPVKTWTRGGLTSLTGVDVTTGREITRYDLEIAVDVAKGHEYKIGLISDTNYSVD